jgi:hypothetical protein
MFEVYFPMNKLIATVLLSAALVLGLAGCGGGGANTQVSTKTLGEELTDLKQAYESGAISEDEYEDARKMIMKKYK